MLVLDFLEQIYTITGGSPGGLVGKESACDADQETQVRSLGGEDPLEEENGNPLQCSCLENSMDRGAQWATVHGVAESDTMERLTHTHTH